MYTKQQTNLRNVATIVACLAVITIFAGCPGSNPKDPVNNGNGTFKVKTATIAFKKADKGVETTNTIMWDDYGNYWRLEDNKGATHVDEKAGKGYSLNLQKKTYTKLDESIYSFAKMGRDLFKFSNSTGMPAYQKLANRTIAGKDCTVYSTTSSGITTVYGSWNGILLLKEESGVLAGTGINVNTSLTATSYSETVPVGSFSVPSVYTLSEP